MAKYTAITIGPVYTTLQLTSSPAGQWAASSLMSWIAETLIENLHEQGVTAEQFVSPYCEFTADKQLVLGEPNSICERMRKKGVGLFHDRIIFTGEHLREAGKAIQDTEKLLAEKLDCDEAWVHSFLRVYAMGCDVPEGEAPLSYLGLRLGAMELEATFPVCEENNPLLQMFENVSTEEEEEYGHANGAIKESFLVKCLPEGEWMLLKGQKIRTMEDIANCGAAGGSNTYSKYYAVLSSDGDNMSKCLAQLKNADDIRAFSKRCLDYCAKIANVILEYGGMPIYAGGDDLLAIIPVVGLSGSIFSLLETLRNIFNETFKVERDKLEIKPTISFGLSVQYHKSPLFEALDRSSTMLRLAKQGEKNSLHLNLQKHGGQSTILEIKKLDSAETVALMKQIEKMIGNDDSTEYAHEQALLAFSQSVERFEPLFAEALKADDNAVAVNLLENLFDAEDQRKIKAVLSTLCELIYAVKKASAEPLEQIKAIARILPFMLARKEGTYGEDAAN